ncbi:hypothetical protein ACFVMC_17060 [Nocardia sp. NPDC127579]|uniref:hypothetical protein n=1 Tax=Nocardia sp. NPDC127579 TaxID=3345402 RepID=UPI00363B4630
MPQQQPVRRPDAPERPYRPASQSDTGAPIEAAFVCDSTTAVRLSRAAALLAWRLPLRWGILLVLPVFLLTHGTIQLLDGASDADPADLVATCCAVLAVELLAFGVLTVVRMVRPSPNIKAYSYSGAHMAASFTPEAMRLNLVTQPLTHEHSDIKKVIATDDVVYLHAVGVNGYVLPRELVPDDALSLLQRPRYVFAETHA